MRLLLSLFCLPLAALISLQAQALDYSEAAGNLCAKMQSCAMADIEAAGLSPEQEEAAIYELASACDDIERSFAVPDGQNRLHALATYCMQALSEQTCPVLLGVEQAARPQHCQVLAEETAATIPQVQAHAQIEQVEIEPLEPEEAPDTDQQEEDWQ